MKSRMLCDAIGFRPLTLRQPLALRLTTPSHDPSPSEILMGQCRASRNCLAELGRRQTCERSQYQMRLFYLTTVLRSLVNRHHR